MATRIASVVAALLLAVDAATAPLSLTNCDGVSTFFCPTGTCYTGYDGYVGCCSVASCAARTTCIAYTSAVAQTCNMNTGGCVTCDSAMPACVTITNVVNSQYIMYCGQKSVLETVSYSNLVTTGSMALPPGRTKLSSSVTSASKASISATSFSTTPSTTSSIYIPTPTDSVDVPNANTIEIIIIVMVTVVGGSAVTMMGGYYCLRHFRDQKRAMRASITAPGRYPPGHHSNDTRSELPDNHHPIRNPHASPRTSATHRSDHISPVAQARLGRLTEGRAALAQELDILPSVPEGSSEFLSAYPSVRLERSPVPSWSDFHPALSRPADPSARWSFDYDVPVDSPSRPRHRRSETVYMPRGTIIRSGPSYELEDPYLVSPSPSTMSSFGTHLVGGLSPLVGRDHDRASRGETYAGDAGHNTRPLSGDSVSPRVSNIQHFPRRLTTKKRRRSDYEGLFADAPTATGTNSAYVTPETAMTEGLPAIKDEETVAIGHTEGESAENAKEEVASPTQTIASQDANAAHNETA